MRGGAVKRTPATEAREAAGYPGLGAKGLVKAAKKLGLKPRSLRAIELGGITTYQRKRAMAALYGCTMTCLMRARQRDQRSAGSSAPKSAGGGHGRRLATKRRAA